jgi:hypothetical protein
MFQFVFSESYMRRDDGRQLTSAYVAGFLILKLSSAAKKGNNVR